MGAQFTSSWQRWDLDGFRFLHVEMHRDWLDPLFWLISCSALGEYIFLIGVLAFLVKPLRPYVLPTLLSALLSGSILCQLLKHLIPRDRPSQLPFAHPQEPFLYNSFPSGHTSAAFGVAVMLCFLNPYGSSRWVGQAAIVWAVLVGVSRIYRGVHWPSDTLGGLCCGLLGASLVYAAYELIGRPLRDQHTFGKEHRHGLSQESAAPN